MPRPQARRIHERSTRQGPVPTPVGATRQYSGAGRDAGPGDTGARDSGSSVAGTVVSPLASTVVAANVGTIDALAIDGATLYALTNENAVWVLEPGSTAPRILAQGAAPAGSVCGHDSRLAFNSSALFWLARPTAAPAAVGEVLHRTERSGSTDTLMVTGISSAPYPVVAADDTRVFWIEEAESSDGNSGGVVRTLSVDAAPGTAPMTLVPVKAAYDIITMTLAGPTLYWVTAFNYTTVPKPATRCRGSERPVGAPTAHTHSSRRVLVGVSARRQSRCRCRRAFRAMGPRPQVPGRLDGEPCADSGRRQCRLRRRLGGGLGPFRFCGNYHHQLVAMPTAAPGGPVVQLADDLVHVWSGDRARLCRSHGSGPHEHTGSGPRRFGGRRPMISVRRSRAIISASGGYPIAAAPASPAPTPAASPPQSPETSQ